jgi:ABC-2 type transport system permease protein
MIASLSAESLKARKRWAYWIILGILLLWIVLLVYIVPYLVFKHPPRRFESPLPPSVLKHAVFPENLVPEVLSTTALIGAAIAIIVGALSTASEYGWLTVQTILIQKPSRGAVLLGKFLALAVIAIVITLVMFAAGAIMAAILINVDGGTSAWPSFDVLSKGFAAGLLEISVWTGFGAFVGIAFRSTAAAIGGGLIYLFVVEGLFAGVLFRDVDVIKDLIKFLPGVSAGAVNHAFPFTYRNPQVSVPTIDATRGTITLLVYLVAFVTLSLLIFRQRDVTGA